MSRIEKSAAIILKRSEFSETSLVVTLLARETGKVTCLAKGARRPRSPLDGAIEPLTLADTVVYYKPPPSMHILSQASTISRWRGLRTDLDRFYRAHYFAELLLWSLPQDLPEPQIFDKAVEAFSMLEEGGRAEAVSFSFEAAVLMHSGHLMRTGACIACGREWKRGETALFQPLSGGAYCRACAAGKKACGTAVSQVALSMLGRIAAGEIPRVDRVSLPERTRSEIRRILDETFRCLFDANPRTRRFIGR